LSASVTLNRLEAAIVCPALADTFTDGIVTTGAWLIAGVAIVELANTPSAN
jgi:hypothetical protein